MAGDRRMYVTLAFASAALAAMVPGVFDMPALATPATIAIGGRVAQTTTIVTTTGKNALPGSARRDDFAASRTDAAVTGVKSGRTRIPVGCERLVSPLVKSAAASQLSRCLT